MSEWLPFERENVEEIPAAAGVYALAQGTEIIYYGRALGVTSTLRSRLMDHLEGDGDRCTKAADWFRYEVCSNPERREIELLTLHRDKHSRLPRCNDVMP